MREAIDGLLAEQGYVILGPTPALIEMLRGRYRFQVLVKGAMSPAAKRGVVGVARKALSDLRSCSLRWDFDPYDLT